MSQAFVSWSGGKDSCLAAYKAQTDGLQISRLANMISRDGKRSVSHGVSAKIIQSQAAALGIPLSQRTTTRETYEDVFTATLRSFKQDGIDYGIFGDIDFNAHREWIERVCRNSEITPLFPLWLQDQSQILSDFIDLGFVSIVVAAKADIFGADVLGRTIDKEFFKYLEELKKTKGVTLCGEAGEYHSLVIDGPLFRKRLEILQARKLLKEGRRFLDILKVDLKDKQSLASRL